MQKKNKKKKFRQEAGRALRLARKGVRSLKANGVAGTALKMARILELRKPMTPSKWMKRPLYAQEELAAQRVRVFEQDVLFSIVTPLYNTPLDFLCDMIDSVLAQTYGNWELCLADGSDADHGYVQDTCLAYAKRDTRIRYRKLEENRGIAANSNASLEMATGNYVALLDHDDVLHPSALFAMMKAICNQDADLVYTDEATFASPSLDDIDFIHFKPDYAPDNLRANNYFCHFTSFKRSLLDAAGPFREGYDGSQDHELMLRLADQARTIVHIPQELYYWRMHPNSTASGVNAKPAASMAGIRAVSDYLASRGIDASVEHAKGLPSIYRISYALPSPRPKVSIIIPNYDHVDDLRACIDSIRSKTTYEPYEIIIAENNSVKLETFEYYEQLVTEDPRVVVVNWPGEFNWAAINNFAIESATGEYLLLLNNDTEVISPNWIEEMLMYAQRPDVGIVGAMLYYPDDTVQHAGVIVGMKGVAAHAFAGVERNERGYADRLCYAQDLSAVTGACVLMRKEVFEQVGGIDESFAVNYNDIDLCLRIREAGYLVVWTPFAELYHYESKSRGLPKTPEDKAARLDEALRFQERWSDILDKGDPYFNPNLSLEHTSFEPKHRIYGK